MKTIKKDWRQLVKDRKAFCYFKPTRCVHDSGYRCFEIGCCEMDETGHKIKDKLVLGQCTDHVWFLNLKKEGIDTISMDMTKDGYIRVFSNHGLGLSWDNNFDFALSSAILSEVLK